MAYDKVVDSSVLNAGLTKIADAIRAKGGTSGQLAFPDGLAAAIEAGGGIEFPDDLRYGHIEVVSDIQKITIKHNLGVSPGKYGFAVAVNRNREKIVIGSLLDNIGFVTKVGIYKGQISTGASEAVAYMSTPTSSEITIDATLCASNYIIPAGSKVIWWVAK